MELDQLPRPTGIDDTFGEWLSLSDGSAIYVGFVPSAKFDAIEAEQLRLHEDASTRARSRDPAYLEELAQRSAEDQAERREGEREAARAKGLKDPGPLDVDDAKRSGLRFLLRRSDPQLREGLRRVERELVRWSVRDWRIEGLPPAELTTERYEQEQRPVLSSASLDMLDARRLLSEASLLVFTYWRLSPEEKKSSKSSATPTSSTAKPASTIASSASSGAATRRARKARG